MSEKEKASAEHDEEELELRELWNRYRLLARAAVLARKENFPASVSSEWQVQCYDLFEAFKTKWTVEKWRSFLEHNEGLMRHLGKAADGALEQ